MGEVSWQIQHSVLYLVLYFSLAPTSHHAVFYCTSLITRCLLVCIAIFKHKTGLDVIDMHDITFYATYVYSYGSHLGREADMVD